MGFEAWLQADPEKTDRLPRVAAVDDAFAGLILRRNPTWQGFVTVGTGSDDECDLVYDSGGGNGFVDHISIFRPCSAMWLWNALYRLMSEYDMFLYWPADPLIAAMARPDVPLPDGMPAQRVVVRSAEELTALIKAS